MTIEGQFIPNMKIYFSPIGGGVTRASKDTSSKEPQTPKKGKGEEAQTKLGERPGATHGPKNVFDEEGERGDQKIPGVDY